MDLFKRISSFDRPVIPVVLALCLVFLIPDPGKETGGTTSQSYSYDDAGRLTQVTYSDGRTINYTYDANGNILSTELSREDKIFLDGFEQLAFLNTLWWGE